MNLTGTMQTTTDVNMIKYDENFAGFEFLDGGSYSFAVINITLKEFDRKQEFPYELVVEITPNDYRVEGQVGQPTRKEAEFLEELEEQLVTYFEKNIASIYIGHLSRAVKREIIFYVQDPDIVDAYLREWIKTSNRNADYEIYDDAIWARVNFFLGHLKA